MPFHAKISELGDITFPSMQIAARWKAYKESHIGARLIIDEEKDDRSTGQLRLYRAWLNSVAASTGNDTEELHTFLLDKCAPRAVVTIKGSKGAVEVEQIKRTSGGHSLSMDKLEMSQFMEKCAQLTGHPLPTEEEKEAMGYIHN